jgi:hypothetical protein
MDEGGEDEYDAMQLLWIEADQRQRPDKVLQVHVFQGGYSPQQGVMFSGAKKCVSA